MEKKKRSAKKGAAEKSRQKTKQPRGNAVNKSSTAGKRSEGGASKAARNAPSETLAGRGQNSKSSNAVKNRSQRSERGTGKVARNAPSTASAGANKPEIAIEKNKDMVIVTLKYHGDKNGGHHHVIVEDIDDCHVSVGLSTRKKKGKNNPNYPLEQSPLGDGKKSYMRRQGTVAPKREYYSPSEGVMTEKNYAKAKEYGDKAKKKYLDKKVAKK